MQRILLAAAGVLLILAARQLAAVEQLTIYTVNYPLQYFAQRIAGEHARVVFPAPAQVDPALWMPDKQTVGAYRRADLVLLNGAGYAKWVEKAALPHSRQVDTSAPFADGYIADQQPVARSHGPGTAPARTGTAYTTWLDFYQAVQQAESVLQALVKKQPAYKAVFERNFAALKKDLMALDLELQKAAVGHPGQPMLASQPVYQYLARRYLLHLETVQWVAGEVPDDAAWQQLRYATEDFPARWMIWEKLPLGETVARLASMGIDVLVFDPCAGKPAQGDFLSVMQQNIHNIKQAYPE